MLKIKNGIDLSELEKFGFEKNDWSWGGYTLDTTDEIRGVTQKVSVNVNIYGDIVIETEFNSTSIPSVVLDLSIAGLLTKGV